MIALVILAIGLLAMLAVQITALNQGKWGRHASEAAQVAGDQMELIRRLPWADPVAQPTGGWTVAVPVTITVQAPAAPVGGFVAQQFNLQWRITAAGFDPNVRLVDVRVNWAENDSASLATPRRYAMSSSKYNEQ